MTRNNLLSSDFLKYIQNMRVQRTLLTLIFTLSLLIAPSIPRVSASTSGLIVYSQGDQLGNSHIFIMNWDGTNPKQLTFGDVEDYAPVWSQDGTRIAFTRDFPGEIYDREVFVMNSDGSGQVNITNRIGWDAHPSWSPDGKSLVFSSDRDGNREIYRFDFGNRSFTRITNTLSVDENRPKYSPNGELIAYLRGVSDIYLINSDGTNENRVTNGQVQKSNFSWSPDGTHFAFNEDGGGYSEIFIIQIDGMNQEKITNSEPSYFDYTPAWSPDGSKIIFESNRSSISDSGSYDLYKMNNDGTSISQLTFNGLAGGANWSAASRITCQRGVFSKEVIAVNPKCPKGYKLKVR